jgi:cytochrome c553
MRETLRSARSIRISLLGLAVAALAVTFTVAPREAKASPQFSQQTGKQCGFCHGKPPALNAQGKKFKAKGNKL